MLEWRIYFPHRLAQTKNISKKILRYCGVHNQLYHTTIGSFILHMIYDFRAKYCTSQIYTYFRIELYCLPSSFLTQRTRVFSSSCVILFDAQISLLSILVFILNDELMSVSCIFLKTLSHMKSPNPPKLRPFGNKFPSLMATQTN